MVDVGLHTEYYSIISLSLHDHIKQNVGGRMGMDHTRKTEEAGWEWSEKSKTKERWGGGNIMTGKNLIRGGKNLRRDLIQWFHYIDETTEAREAKIWTSS